MLLSLLLFVACSREIELTRLSGETMGTTWHVSLRVPVEHTPEQLAETVQQALDRVNASMSTYRPDSDLGRFNQSPTMQWIDISPDTFEVTRIALQVARETDNAFNPAVAELVDLWGFGPTDREGVLPSAAQIATALADSQLDNLEFDQVKPAMRKLAPMQLDYSAIAKGYGVDLVALRMEQAGVRDYMIEVGGEVRTAGRHSSARPWRIGIERPQLAQGDAIAAIALGSEAVATSGDYRNYREVDGVRFAHTIDPVTGYPVVHTLASVTVIAPTATLADAYATAINVMGPERGLEFAEEMALPVYMLVKEEQGFAALMSAAFAPYTE